ncbi:exocyst complex component 4 [Trichonephila inaurata madagascariensis]|uniref:Exocyst complex component Sec8 n=1 Tax=Trichonephila inaurata madagascariensis TaxID=2747483 RepID=A0A8X6WRS5_9ARAC|nr:exocyst complex component 4 [Trichonephila inaurata madagascariensis]
MNKSQYTPVRPPRGSKVSKDTSGRLMNIIAELSVSKNNDDRKRKMLELKKDFDTCDGRLVELISAHREELSVTMESFSKISAKINSSRTGCRLVTEKLSACKKLLECKRDEIRRLRAESVEHREVINMLREINDLNQVHGNVEAYLKEEQFLKATELLVSSLNLMNGKLAGVEGLKDLKSELITLRKKLHEKLVQEIHKHLYMTPENIFLHKKSDLDPKSKSYEETFTYNRYMIKLPAEGTCCDFSADINYQQIAIILKCIALLDSLSETVEILKENCSKELMKIVRNSTEVMYGMIPQNTSYACEVQPLFSGVQIKNPHPHFLLDLLNSILNQFRQVAVNHYAFLDNLERIAMTKALPDVTQQYEIADIYSKLQATVELFVADYLDFHSAVTHRTTAAFAKVPTAFSDISSFFLRKTVTRTKKQSLFKFDSSSHAINKKTYLQEQKDSMKEKGELDSVESGDRQILVCQPSVKNIILIYKTLRKFITDIEEALQLESGNCPLHSFLIDCVKVFLDQVSVESNRLLERITTSLETWQPVIDPEEYKLYEAKTPVLKSTLAVNSCLIEMEEFINALPDYSSYFLQLMCHILQSYKDLSYGAYKSLIYPDSEDQRIFSLTWTRDEDISRLLRSLPNWTNLKINDDSAHEGEHNFEESPEEIRFRNKEESDLLIRNLSFAKDSISINEIISEHSKLRNLALMHESMEWFSSRILAFAQRLPDVQGSVRSLLPDKFNDESDLELSVGISTKVSLKKLAEDFEDLADTCLLVIHLEIRAHCFYYLLQLSKQGSYMSRKDDEEPEPEILKLNADLTKIDESLSPVLQPKKMRYIFEGLGELLSTILINSINNIKKINENKVKKMGRNIFAIQQNLAGITMTREVALDRARQYFELLNHTYEEILNQIVEEGPQFQEHEYSALILLLHNSREGIYEQEPVQFYLEKLRQILDEVAVSV